MANTNLVPTGKYTHKAAKQERAGLDNERSNSFLKLKAGKNILRILPPPEGKESPFFVAHQHFFDGNDGKMITFICPRMSSKGKKPCKACERSAELKASGNPIDRDDGFKMQPQRRVFCYAIDRRNMEKGVQVWAFGKGIHDELVTYAEDEDDPCDFTDPLDGQDIAIIKSGEGLKTRYKVNLAPRTSQLAEDVEQMNAYILAQEPLEKYGELISDAEIIRAINGERPERGGNKALARNAGKRTNPRDFDDENPKSKAVDADFDEDGDDDDLPDGY